MISSKKAQSHFHLFEMDSKQQQELKKVNETFSQIDHHSDELTGMISSVMESYSHIIGKREMEYAALYGTWLVVEKYAKLQQNMNTTTTSIPDCLASINIQNTLLKYTKDLEALELVCEAEHVDLKKIKEILNGMKETIEGQPLDEILQKSFTHLQETVQKKELDQSLLDLVMNNDQLSEICDIYLSDEEREGSTDEEE